MTKAHTSDCDLANINPFRYRGYVYDSETGLYYLKSRYYDPVTGRFLNADMYCDTQSNIFGTNMFAYCNNNWVNQIDPEGTDAYWVQFGNAVNGMGHTSLLLQDSVNNWWYFYWGPKHAILRPCGKKDFTIEELNSYLNGFDPRKGYNLYVYALNAIDSNDDINCSGEYATKLHDNSADGLIRLNGNFTKSLKYAKELLEKLYSNSNANQLTKTIYENGKKINIYDVCNIYKENINQYVPDHTTPAGYHYLEIKGNGKCKSYDLFSYNCVQASMDILLKGTFYGHYEKQRNIIIKNRKGCVPNYIYNKLKKTS